LPSILIIYDSSSGNTEKAAMLVAEGVKQVKGVLCAVKKVDDVSVDELAKVDGVIIGSPTYYGTMSGKIKTLLDETVKHHGRLAGKVGAAFTSSAGNASGAETTILSILQGLLIHGMIIQGAPNAQHYGLAVIGAPNEREKEICKEFGTRIAKLTAKVAGAK
jgi:NAD(P)H dehydrogenase (quinone)